jgi:hypothetical protein
MSGQAIYLLASGSSERVRPPGALASSIIELARRYRPVDFAQNPPKAQIRLFRATRDPSGPKTRIKHDVLRVTSA